MIDPKFIINLRGRDFPTWPGVLDAATRAGLRSIKTTVVQIPSAENGGMAVVMARAEFEDGRIYEDVGDASPANCGPQIATAALRMASTRAKGRCLRDALNIGQTMFEELPDEEKFAPVTSRPETGSAVEPSVPTVCQECGLIITDGQRKLSQTKYGRTLCPSHQRMEKLSANGNNH
jgi:hypothetical protein